MAKFFEMLQKRWDAGARVCIGLDTDPAKLPVTHRLTNGYGYVAQFNTDIIVATKQLALAYKLNIAFYSGRHLTEAHEALRDTIDTIRQSAPGVPIIFDAKRADIGNTNVGYVEEAFEAFGADAVTVNPYFGMEAMKPFLDQKDKGIIVLCRTSNPGADEFQDLMVQMPNPRLPSDLHNLRPLYKQIAVNVARNWNYNCNCALVVGATAPNQLGQVRKIVGDDMWILIPGIGKQGGDLEKSVQNGINRQGRGIIINSSSGIIFASSDPRTFAQAAYAETKKLTDGINAALPKLGSLVDIKV